MPDPETRGMVLRRVFVSYPLALNLCSAYACAHPMRCDSPRHAAPPLPRRAHLPPWVRLELRASAPPCDAHFYDCSLCASEGLRQIIRRDTNPLLMIISRPLPSVGAFFFFQHHP